MEPDTKTSPSSHPLTSSTLLLLSLLKYALGQRVEAQFARKAKFYKGTVTKVLPNDRYAISYVDGDKEASVHVRYMRFDPRLIACAGDTARVIVAGLMEKYKPVVVEKPKVMMHVSRPPPLPTLLPTTREPHNMVPLTPSTALFTPISIYFPSISINNKTTPPPTT